MGNMYPDFWLNREAVRLVLILLYLAGDLGHFTAFTEVDDVGRLVR